jgi:aminoglycoside 3-N-acetyltransferase
MGWIEKNKEARGSPESVAVVTSRELRRELEQLGVRPGGVLVVHSSLSALGYVLHGADAVVEALRGAIGPEGTIVVPTFTGSLTDPSCWVDPALPSSMWTEVRDAMPVYDRERTLPRLMGQVATRVLLDPDSRRSDHPLTSFCALGPRAAELVAGHDLCDPLGPDSPIGRARAAGGQVLLLGVDQRRNSALMHAHCLAGVAAVRHQRGPFLAGGQDSRRWVTPKRIAECTEGYGQLEDELVTRGFVRVARVGDGTVRLMELDEVVTFAEHKIRVLPESVECTRLTCRQCQLGV